MIALVRRPLPFHQCACLFFSHAGDVAMVAIEEGGHPVVGDAVDVNRLVIRLVGSAEFPEMAFFGRIERDGNMGVAQASAGQHFGLAIQRSGSVVGRKVDDVTHSEIFELVYVVLKQLA